MDLRSLACFVAVAEALHFRRAAEQVHLTQPALSMRIRALEDQLGTALFERNRRRVELTAAGAALLPEARLVLAHAARGKQRAQQAALGEAGVLRLGFTVIAFHGLLPRAVRAYRQRYPEVGVDLRELNAPGQEAALAADELDLGILHPPLATAGLAIAELPDEPLLLALPASHRLALCAEVGVEALAGEPFLIAPRQVGPSIHDRIVGLFERAGVALDVVQEATPMTTLLGLVAAGVGIGFVTRGVGRGAGPEVTCVEVAGAPSLPVAAAWRREHLSPCARQFLAVVHEVSAGGHAPP